MTDRVERELERAEQLYSIGHTDGAIDVLRQILTEDPDQAEAHAWLAICLLRKRRLHAAGIEADMAITLAPDSLMAHWVSAELSLARRRFDRAGEHIERLLADAPEAPGFHRLKARWLSLTGRGRERLAVLEQALACDPDDPETLADLADYHRIAGDLDKAEGLAREALAVSAQNASALVAMGHILLNRSDTEGAREHALAALQADPEDTGALTLLTAVKARSNIFLGLWWRYATWGMRVGPTRNIVVLLVAYIAYRALTIAASDVGSQGAAGIITVLWLAIVVYSFAGPTLFSRALKKEFESVALRKF